MVVTLFSPCV